MAYRKMQPKKVQGPTKKPVTLYSTLVAGLRTRFKSKGFPRNPTVLDCGLFHGHSDFRKLFIEVDGGNTIAPAMEVDSDVNNGEEHRTSALMGLISAHLGWYRVIGDLAGKNVSIKCQWGATTKNQEARNGADFGVVIEVGKNPRKPKERLYNIAFFQAKLELERVKSNGVQIKISQPPSGYSVAKVKAKADKALEKWALRGELNVSEAEVNSHYQIIKLAVLDAKLRDADLNNSRKAKGNKHSYAHYAVWRRQDDDALVTPLESIRSFCEGRLEGDLIKRNMSRATKNPPVVVSSTYTYKQTATSFPAFISSGQKSNAEGWATIGESRLPKIIESWPVLGTSWMIFEQADGTLNNVFKNSAELSVLPALVGILDMPQMFSQGFTQSN